MVFTQVNLGTSCRKAFSSSAAAPRTGVRAAAFRPQCSAERERQQDGIPRRVAMAQSAAAIVGVLNSGAVPAVAAPPPKDLGAAASTDAEKVLCDASCAADLGKREKTSSGLEYTVITPGKGQSPPIGVQAAVHYVAMTPEGRIFDNSLMKGTPYYIRIGSGALVAGLDEALLNMATGEVRRVYVPGDLAFPKGLASAPGRERSLRHRPKVPPKSPVVFDVQLIYIPGISDDLEVAGAE